MIMKLNTEINNNDHHGHDYRYDHDCDMLVPLREIFFKNL